MTESITKNASLRSKFVAGGSWALIGKIISSTATLGVNILLARLLSTEDMGSFFLAFSVVSTFAIIAQWGLGRGLVKLVASELAVGNIGNVRSTIISASIIVAFLSFCIAVFLYSPAGEWFLNKLSGADQLVSLASLLGFWIFVFAFQGIVSESFRGCHDIRMATIFGGMLTAIVAVLLYFYLWIKSGGIELADAVQFMVFATTTSLCIGAILLIKKIDENSPAGVMGISKIYHFGLPLMLTNLLLFSTLEFHMWVLAYYQPETELAMYGASLRLVLLLAMPLTIINAVIPPMVADMYSRNQFGSVQNLLQKTASIMIIPAIVVFLVIIIYGAEILELVYGASYSQAYIPFCILAIGQLVNVLTGSPGILLTMSGHERVVFKTAITSSILGLVVSSIGVQMYGAAGAALGYAFGIVANNVAMWAYSLRKLTIRTHGNVFLLASIIKSLQSLKM